MCCETGENPDCVVPHLSPLLSCCHAVCIVRRGYGHNLEARAAMLFTVHNLITHCLQLNYTDITVSSPFSYSFGTKNEKRTLNTICLRHFSGKLWGIFGCSLVTCNGGPCLLVLVLLSHLMTVEPTSHHVRIHVGHDSGNPRTKHSTQHSSRRRMVYVIGYFERSLSSQ